MKRKNIRRLTLVFLFLLFFFGCEEFWRRRVGGFAGSYPFAETWTINATEAQVIRAINKIKEAQPGLKPPRDSSYRYSYWYYVDFCYPGTKQVAHAWTRENNDGLTTTLALVGFSALDDPHYYKDINRDFWYVANRIEINKFNKRVIDKIREELGNP